MNQPKQSNQPKQPINSEKCPICRCRQCSIFIDENYMWEDYAWTDDDLRLEDSDFDAPLDDRVWKSLIEDIEGGDNFVDFCDEFFKMLDEEGYWE